MEKQSTVELGTEIILMGASMIPGIPPIVGYALLIVGGCMFARSAANALNFPRHSLSLRPNPDFPHDSWAPFRVLIPLKQAAVMVLDCADSTPTGMIGDLMDDQLVFYAGLLTDEKRNPRIYYTKSLGEKVFSTPRNTLPVGYFKFSDDTSFYDASNTVRPEYIGIMVEYRAVMAFIKETEKRKF